MYKEFNEDDNKVNEICKKVFFINDDITINIINYLFQENFNKKDVIVSNYSMDVIEREEITGTCNIVEIQEVPNGMKHCYNISFETDYEPKKVFKMQSYIQTFIRNKYEEDRKNFSGEKKLSLKQLAVFLKKDENIEDFLSWDLRDVYQLNFIYKVPALKLWEFDINDFIDNKVYPLIPLKLFDFKRKLELIKKQSESDDSLFRDVFMELKEKIYEIGNIFKELYLDKCITKENLKDVLTIVQDIFVYLSTKYYYDEQLNSEVTGMLKLIEEF